MSASQPLVCSFDPAMPRRDPRSRKSIDEATKDMARIIAVLAPADILDATVTRDQLHQAGFSNGEIDHCFARAMVLVAEKATPQHRAVRR